MKRDFSVCMSVYKNDKPAEVAVALDSVINQSVRPAEIVLVVDGPIPDALNGVLDEFSEKYVDLFNIIRLPENKGLGNALMLATEVAKYELVARMDSDDICMPGRFEKQLACFEQDPDLSIVGGTISEFIDTPDNVVGHRVCPLTDVEIKEYMKSRCGFNHMTVMFRKSEVLRVGNYQDWFWNEDYYLWLRMLLAGCKFANLPDTLVNVRVGRDMYARRGGWRYFKSEAGIQRYMWEHKLIGFPKYLYNVAIRFAVQVAMPNSLRGWVFRTFARK
ncbi:MAG: glycosyltransferase [Bacteroidaceae bacterium]|nr:glycosyltransferase [Bacteroidaceae bacterium]